MFLEMALGDAYGAGFEFKSRAYIHKHHTMTRYLPHSVSQKAGCYTDDTQMSVVIGEHLLFEREWTYGALANGFVDGFRRDPRKGYARGFQSLLESVANGNDLLACVRPLSRRNGAAMRSVPVGVLPLDQLQDFSRLHAVLTHNSTEGVDSALAVALISHYFLYKLGDPESLLEFVCTHSSRRWDGHWQGEVGCDGLETVNAVFQLLNRFRPLTEILKGAVDFGGDVDSVAAIALSVASCRQEFQDDLPEWMIADLEDGDYGAPFLKELDFKFSNKFNLSREKE